MGHHTNNMPRKCLKQASKRLSHTPWTKITGSRDGIILYKSKHNDDLKRLDVCIIFARFVQRETTSGFLEIIMDKENQ